MSNNVNLGIIVYYQHIEYTFLLRIINTNVVGRYSALIL